MEAWTWNNITANDGRLDDSPRRHTPSIYLRSPTSHFVKHRTGWQVSPASQLSIAPTGIEQVGPQNVESKTSRSAEPHQQQIDLRIPYPWLLRVLWAIPIREVEGAMCIANV